MAARRRRAHRIAKPHDDIDELSLSLPPGTTAEALVAKAEEHVRLRACVDPLCETEKAVVMLRLLEEQGGADVAASLASRAATSTCCSTARRHRSACA